MAPKGTKRKRTRRPVPVERPPVPSNYERYLRSLADELVVQSRRVRDLIGDAHWLSDGHQKEYLLLELLSRHLPAGMLATRGFVVHPRRLDLRSTEQDILIIDTTREAPIFNQGGLAICLPGTVAASISVKTTLDLEELEDAVKGLTTVRRLTSDHEDGTRVWTAAFFFETPSRVRRKPTAVYRELSSAMVKARAGGNAVRPPVDVVCTAGDFAYLVDVDATSARTRVRGFSCGGLGTAVLVARLLAHLGALRGEVDSELLDFATNAITNPLTPPEYELG